MTTETRYQRIAREQRERQEARKARWTAELKSPRRRRRKLRAWVEDDLQALGDYERNGPDDDKQF